MTRDLDYCAVRSIGGAEIADEMFGRKFPDGIDMDQPGDQVLAEGILRDREKCETCPQRAFCESGYNA